MLTAPPLSSVKNGIFRARAVDAEFIEKQAFGFGL
jgi:hypothetical protein